MRVRRSKAQIAAGVTLEQLKAERSGAVITPAPVLEPIPEAKYESLVLNRNEIMELIQKLERSKYDGGYSPSMFAAYVLKYITGEYDCEEFETAHAEIFRDPVQNAS